MIIDEDLEQKKELENQEVGLKSFFIGNKQE